MDIPIWKEHLTHLPLGDIYLYSEVGSTNLVAEQKIKAGAPPFSLVIADSQTEGKGRLGRSWITRAGKALALSWILYPEPGRLQPETLSILSGLAPVAVVEVLREIYALPAEIKWPNDVLVEGKKAAGVLVDVRWNGCLLTDVVLGIGVNVARGSVPPPQQLNFPAISLEEAAGKEISRLKLLTQIMGSLIKWYSRLVEPSFIQAWNSMLAFKGQKVNLTTERGLRGQGEVLGISDDGSLILISEAGQETEYHSGEIQLRLVDRS
jgi:BirA family transcriptional regulator, biotin operon repressor / biotin---[acetyl-CoA-carboxylase] ligase